MEESNAEYAARDLETDPEVSALMPCFWGVYEGFDGGMHISGINPRPPGTLFGGTIVEVTREDMASDKKAVPLSLIKS